MLELISEERSHGPQRRSGDTMTTSVRKNLMPPTRSQWNSIIDLIEGTEPSQAGEIAVGLEDGGGGDKGIDADTGSGGYGGDAVEAGYDAALAEPDRPLDDEIHGDPRTPAGSAYPDETTSNDDARTPIGEAEVPEDATVGAEV
jgi:hypothetical protein